MRAFGAEVSVVKVEYSACCRATFKLAQSLWQINFMSIARIRIVAGHLKEYWKKSIVGFACFEQILLIAVYIIESTARA